MDKLNLEERLIYFDKNFCVVTKFPGENVENQLPEIFRPLIEKRIGKKCEVLQCPHRLDMPVSGVQIICFTNFALRFFSSEFSNNKVKKTYWAIVEGKNFSKKEETLENYLVFNPEKKKAYIFDFEKRKSKKAILDYKIFSSGENYSYLLVFPKTGRTHQIRSQLAYNNMHIKGDIKYGSRRSDSIDGIRLFAYSLETKIPGKNEIVKFTSNLPFIDNLWQNFIDEFERLEK